MVRLFMNVGRSQKITVKDIVSTVAIEADIPARDIGLINIYDKFSFVEVPEDVAEKVIGAMDRNYIKKYRAMWSLQKSADKCSCFPCAELFNPGGVKWNRKFMET